MAAQRDRVDGDPGAPPSPAAVLGPAAGLFVLLLLVALITSPGSLLVRVGTEPPPAAAPAVEPTWQPSVSAGQAAPPRPAPVEQAEPVVDRAGEVAVAVQDLLRVRDAAVAAGSGADDAAVAEADWLRTYGTAAEDGAGAFTVLSSLPVTGFESSLVADSIAPLLSDGSLAAGGEARDADSWQARVETSYELADGPAVVRTDTIVVADSEVVADSDDGWQVRSWTPFPAVGEIGTTAPWELGPVQAGVGERVVVLSWLGDGDAAAAGSWGDQVSAWSDAGATTVDSYLGTGWPRTTLVLAPATAQQYADLVPGPRPVSDEVFAAVTTDIATPDGLGDLVVLNPAARGQLVEETWQVTITHELAHVASGALHGDRQEIWLAEGVADLIGWSRLVPGTVERETVAVRFLERVADGTVAPDQLPDTDAFTDPDADVVGDAYEGSWLAVLLLQDELGTDGLLALYADASQGDGSARQRIDGALRRATGDGRTAFQTRWGAYVQSLAVR